MLVKLFITFLCIGSSFLFSEETRSNGKALICGVCKDVEASVPYTIKNAEALGKRFQDYRVVIYENNSKDKTASLLSDWAAKNPKVIFKSENLPKEALAISRTEKIARARNIVLDVAKSDEYKNYDYFIMVDLDFQCDWPIDEVIATANSPRDWDCVSANGQIWGDVYWDRYAFRDKARPWGPELMGDPWWKETLSQMFRLNGSVWLPVYSAFGGMAIFKMPSIITASYSGVVTPELANYYKNILKSLSPDHPKRIAYLEQHSLAKDADIDSVQIQFKPNTLQYCPAGYLKVICCEHVPLHAAMAAQGHNKFFVNQKMRLSYDINIKPYEQ